MQAQIDNLLNNASGTFPLRQDKFHPHIEGATFQRDWEALMLKYMDKRKAMGLENTYDVNEIKIMKARLGEEYMIPKADADFDWFGDLNQGITLRPSKKPKSETADAKFESNDKSNMFKKGKNQRDPNRFKRDSIREEEPLPFSKHTLDS